MGLLTLVVIYGMVGLGFVVAVLARRAAEARSVVDLALLVLFWPLYGPFVLMSPRPAVAEEKPTPAEADLLEALGRACGTPLADLLPDAQTGSALAERLRTASAKLDEIDALLARPDFDEGRAEARHRELEAEGEARAAAIAGARVQSIRRLRGLRDRFRRDLEEVGELVAQLRIQAEVVRIAEACDDGTRELVSQLLHRVNGLDELIEAVHG